MNNTGGLTKQPHVILSDYDSHDVANSLVEGRPRRIPCGDSLAISRVPMPPI